MRSKLISENAGDRTYLLSFDIGDEVLESLTAFAREWQIGAARIMAIGGFSQATLGYFELDRRDYKPIEVSEQVEVVSLLGNIATDVSKPAPEPKVHVHAILGRSNGSTVAGHLLSGLVRPTLEMSVIASGVEVEKSFDPATGLTLLRL